MILYILDFNWMVHHFQLMSRFVLRKNLHHNTVLSLIIIQMSFNNDEVNRNIGKFRGHQEQWIKISLVKYVALFYIYISHHAGLISNHFLVLCYSELCQVCTHLIKVTLWQGFGTQLNKLFTEIQCIFLQVFKNTI